MQKGSNRTIRTVTKMRIAYISPKAFISLLVMQFSLFKLTKLSSTLTQHALYSDSIVRTISKGPMNFTRASSRQCLSKIGVSRLELRYVSKRDCVFVRAFTFIFLSFSEI